MAPGAASARRGDLRLSLEPGVASLVDGGVGRSWGWLGGASASLGVAELLSVEAHVDAKRFADADVLVWGGALTYALDLLPATPVFALGFARSRVRGRNATVEETTAQLGVGLDVRVSRWVAAGVIFRYYPLFGTDLLAPAYSSLNARIGLFWGDP